MNLKKNDKLILIVGVVILIVAAIGIAFYTSADVDDIVTESDKKTFDITWNEVTTDKPVINGVAKKSYSESEPISAPDGSILTKVEFQLTWEDDYTSGFLLNKGEDTLTAKIGKSGAEPEMKTSIKEGTITFPFNVNDRPSDYYVEAENANEAKKIADEKFPNENEASFDVTVDVQTGEKLRPRLIKILRYFQDKGNSFDLNITYTYYVFNIEGPEEDENGDDDVPPTGLGGYDGACGEFYKNLCYGRGMI